MEWSPLEPLGRGLDCIQCLTAVTGAGHPVLWFDRGMAEEVRAEIVASVLEVVVGRGDQIGPGDTLVLLESMKMEIPVLAEAAGTVTEVNVAVGDVIQAGHLIAVID